MKKSKVLTFLLSSVPGVGHYYLGHMQRGLQLNLLFFGLIIIFSLTGLGILAELLPVIWFYALFDALQIANALNEGESVIDQPLEFWKKLPFKGQTAGWILIILGVYSFLTVNRYVFLRWMRFFPPGLRLDNMLVALLLIGFGIYLLTAATNGSGEDKIDEGGKMQ